MPGISTGCIAFRDTEDDPTVPSADKIFGKENLLEFEQLMAETSGCVCGGLTVPTTVEYRVAGDDGDEGTADNVWPIGNLGVSD
jgi:hypothetical protein